MVVLQGQVVEKWTNRPLPDAAVTFNQQAIMPVNAQGVFAAEVQTGAYKLCISAPNHESACINVMVVSNMILNRIELKPVAQAL